MVREPCSRSTDYDGDSYLAFWSLHGSIAVGTLQNPPSSYGSRMCDEWSRHNPENT
ncbi:MAG: hypothetical protein U5R06_16400 [candidate division KSB1 bacterium]|nr:hypothetical protein [candidate division KSB1 bacterium]